MDATLTWAMIVGMGVYQGFDPFMGWLAAAGRGFQKRSARPIVTTLAAFAVGHYLAMASLLVPVSLLLLWTTFHPLPQFGPFAAFLQPVPVIAAALASFAVFKLLRPRHPALLARIPPDRRIRWSFTAAFLHCGSPIMMLLPFFSLAVPLARSGGDPQRVIVSILALALLIPIIMILPLFLTAGSVGLTVWRFLGLGALTRFWFNFDIGWGLMNVSMAFMAVGMGNGEMHMSG